MADLKKELSMRHNQKLLLIQNPNYFGNLTKLKIKGIPKPVFKKIGDTTFEELTCIGYNPKTEILSAIIQIKKGSGFLGNSCTDGSREYVRFYLDYGDGTWIDHGVTGFDAHDLGFKKELCYAVSIRLNSEKKSCCDNRPVLPRIRAILSWNIEPPPNIPNYPPVWGNWLEGNIQIAPRSTIFCQIIDQLAAPGVKTIDPQLLKKVKEQLITMEPVPQPVAPLAKLIKKVDRRDKLALMRMAFPMMAKLATDKTDIAAAQSLKTLTSFKIDLSKFEDFILNPEFNTTYEELHCVGLNPDLESLHGVVQIKRKSGFSGDLCDAGSREYIAFYLNFGSGWEYQGVTYVNVHDIDEIPEGGLWYQASLPVTLDDHKRKWCETGQARIRGILSWATPPPPNQPQHIPHWGDWADCRIEIKPLPKGVSENVFTPILEAIGNIGVQKINGTGYANGEALGSIYTAEDSPFGGNILLAGNSFFIPPGSMEYRIMLQGPSDATPQAFTKNFRVDVTTYPSSTPVSQTQIASGEWFQYLPTNPFISVAGGLLGVLRGLENGLHTVYLDFRQPAGPVLANTSTHTFMVDNTQPKADVEITSGLGNCGKFTIGELIQGTFSMTEIHSRRLTLSVTPGPESHGGTLEITSSSPSGASTIFPITEVSTGGSSTKTSVSMFYHDATLDTNGVTNGTWELDSSGMISCGYNIRIHVWDRTIVSSGSIGWEGGDIEGFCVEEG